MEYPQWSSSQFTGEPDSLVMIRSFLRLAVLFVACGAWAAQALPLADRLTPGYVRVQLETSEGAIVVALDMRRAPKTSANFLAYVDDGRFDSTSFYRAARSKRGQRTGYVQGGTRTDVRRNLPPVEHEPTSQTGIRHADGTISMARGGSPGSAMGNFFITAGAAPIMDAQGGYAGYAAFGHVVSGMDVVRRILAKPTGGGVGPMRGQMILNPVKIIRARRLDGAPKPTGRAKAWLLWERR